MLLEVLCNIPAKAQGWVWEGVIPEGQLTLLMGEPGVGKSMFAMDASARLTRGQRGLADGEPGEPSSVILFSGEDDFATVVRSRLDAAGADHRFVNVAENVANRKNPGFERDSMIHEDLDLQWLEDYVTELGRVGEPCRLVVVDPVNCFLEGTDGRDDAKAREMMAKLSDLAVRSGAAILLVAKPSRHENGKRGHWSTTTPVLAEAARSVWRIVLDPDEPGRRVLLPVKTNLCETPPGLAFTIRDQRICWEDESVALTAEQYLAEASEQQRLQQMASESELSRVTEWLKVRLRDGKVYSNDLKADATQNDFSKTTLRRGLILLGCRKGKDKNATGQWHWRLPTPLVSPEGSTISPVANTNREPAAEMDSTSKITKS